MAANLPVYISVAIEGKSDEGMACAVVAHVGFTLAKPPIVKNGKSNLDLLISKLAATNVQNPWIVFRDADAQCPVRLREELIRARPHDGSFELRIVKSMTEAWLMADAKGFARYFRLSMRRMSQAPDELPHAKRALLSLMMKSDSRRIQEEMVTKAGKAGPLYVHNLNDFAQNYWDICAARRLSPSLDRTLDRLEEMRCILSSSNLLS